MYTFFDTETNGLPKVYTAPISDSENWPRLIQLAYCLADKDDNVWMEDSFIIKPVGFTIPDKAAEVHGITTERAMDEGVDLYQTLQDFAAHVYDSEIVVAHNIFFDKKIIYAEYYRNKMEESIEDLSNKEKICTMHKSTKHCQLPKPSGRGGYKWPKLEELYKVLFDEEMVGAHDALVDIKATTRCFWELKRLGVIEVKVIPVVAETKPEELKEKGFGSEGWGE